MPANIVNNASGFLQSMMIPLLLIAAFALMIIPQRKKEKKMKSMLAAIKEGDKVRTIGGFYGKVVKVKADVFVIECGPDKVKLEINKNAIGTVENSDVENDELVTSKK